MRKPIEIKHVKLKQWKTAIRYAVCEDVASLILPSYTIQPSSPAAVKCDLHTGEVTLPKGNTFLRESSIRELDNVQFRIACYENAIPVKMVSHAPRAEFNLLGMLESVVTTIEEPKVRFCYGGDMIETPRSLQCIVNLAAKFQDKQFVCLTGNGAVLSEYAMGMLCEGAIQPPNLYIFCEDGGSNTTELFPSLTHTEDGDVPDEPDWFPSGTRNVRMKIHPDSSTRRQKQVSWWQPTKNNK